jgi:hypothetical protein
MIQESVSRSILCTVGWIRHRVRYSRARRGELTRVPDAAAEISGIPAERANNNAPLPVPVNTATIPTAQLSVLPHGGLKQALTGSEMERLCHVHRPPRLLRQDISRSPSQMDHDELAVSHTPTTTTAATLQLVL